MRSERGDGNGKVAVTAASASCGIYLNHFGMDRNIHSESFRDVLPFDYRVTAILAVAVYWIGVASIEQTVNILIAGLTFYLLQRIGRTIVAVIALLHTALANVIRK